MAGWHGCQPASGRMRACCGHAFVSLLCLRCPPGQLSVCPFLPKATSTSSTHPPAAPQNFVTQRLQQMPGVQLAAPQGAFYVMPEVSAFAGSGVEAKGWGPVPDVDALCRWVLMLPLPAFIACVWGECWPSLPCVCCLCWKHTPANTSCPTARPAQPLQPLSQLCCLLLSLPVALPACCCCRYLIEVANVALVPGDAFGAPTCIRISYAASLETLGAALDRIAAALAPENFSRSSS